MLHYRSQAGDFLVSASLLSRNFSQFPKVISKGVGDVTVSVVIDRGKWFVTLAALRGAGAACRETLRAIPLVRLEPEC